MVVIDATTLLLFLQPDTPGPTDAEGKPLPHARERVEYLIERLDAKPRETIAIPTPVLSEVLMKRDPTDARRIVNLLNRRAVFSIEPFDQRAAIELALMVPSPPPDGPETWAKLKFDRQIVAIAKARGATTIYSDDRGIYRLGEAAEISVVRTRDLELPPGLDQTDLFSEDEGTP